MTDQPDHHQIPWGMPGPTDPVERARATGLEYDGDRTGR